MNINTKGGTRCGPQTPHRAVRKNDWKLIVGGGGPPSGWYNPYSVPVDSPGLDYIQLFNLRTDPSETVNVAAGNPSIVIDLLRELKVTHTRHISCYITAAKLVDLVIDVIVRF